MAALRERLTRWLPPRLRPGGELAVDTVRDALDDRVPGLAAEVAFYSLLSLPPLLLTLFAAAGIVARQFVEFDLARAAQERTLELIGPFLDQSATTDLALFVEQVVGRAKGSLLSLGFIVTLFTASRALRVLTVAITIAYDLEDARPTWKQFVYGIGLTLAVLVASIAFVPLVLAGPGGGAVLLDYLDLAPELAAIWHVGYWPGVGVIAVLAFAVLYHVAAPWWTPWRRDLPGAVLATFGVLLGTAGLRVYYEVTFTGDGVFGPLAAPIALMLWLYVVAFAVLLGAELNAEIEKRWPTERGPYPTSTPTADRAPVTTAPGSPPPEDGARS